MVSSFLSTLAVASGMDTADWAQMAGAFFTALAAFAACASVFRVERDRWRSTLPDLHMEVVTDLQNDKMRLTVVNQGGPAREVRVLGTIGDFGFYGPTEPTTYWRAGESRSYELAMPLTMGEEVKGFVEGRDLGKRQLVLGTPGGASYRWPLRKARKLSAQKQWEKLYPGAPLPIDVPYSLVKMTLEERST